MWSLRIPESARLPGGLGVGGKVGKGTRSMCVLERGSLQMRAGMDLLVLMGASLFLDRLPGGTWTPLEYIVQGCGGSMFSLL